MGLLLPSETTQGLSFSNEGAEWVDVHHFTDGEAKISVQPTALPELLGEDDTFRIIKVDGQIELPPREWSPNARMMLVLTGIRRTELLLKD